MDLFIIVLGRAALGFGTLWIVTRLIGNKQLDQLNIFTYISSIAVGSMAGAMVVYHDIQIIQTFYGLLIWGGFTILLELGSLKSRWFRKLTGGQAAIVIREGRILYPALKKQRLHLDDLLMLLRSGNVFSITEVSYAILELNGKLSILRKTDRYSPLREEINIPIHQFIPFPVISDGKILEENLKSHGYDKQWLFEQLAHHHIFSHKNVLYAEVQTDKQLYWQLR